MRVASRYILFCGVALLLAACGGGESSRERIPADAPGYVAGKPVHPSIKIGKPYRVMGERYYPEYEPDYDEEGLASWYGPNFHGKMTANGETYNQWAMTAAHTTLPMPSMVRVTAVDTGKSVVVRINDRGPFADDRIIDLSRAAAEALGTRAKGIAKVRVQYLKPETEAYIAKLQLKKPDEWREVDVAQAEIEQALETPPAPMPPQPEPEPVMHAETADVVPEHFAYEDTTPHITTVNARGVVMEEIGYAEDAFSVLEEQAYQRKMITPPSAYRRPARPVLQPSVPPLVRETGKQLYVRAGTFGNKDNAERLAQQVRSVAEVQVTPLSIQGRPYWRVSLGPAFNRGIANEIRTKLTNYGIVDAAIVEE